MTRARKTITTSFSNFVLLIIYLYIYITRNKEGFWLFETREKFKTQYVENLLKICFFFLYSRCLNFYCI